MLKNRKQIFGLAILLILIVWLGVYLYQHSEDFKQLSLVSPKLIFALIIIFLINYLITGIMTIELLRPLHIRLGIKEAFSISLMTGFYNLITPFRGGIAARALYLNKKHSFSYSDFMAALSANYILVFLVASIIGIITSIIIFFERDIFNPIIFGVFIGVALPLTAIVFSSREIPYTKYRIFNFIIKTANGWQVIKRNKRVIVTNVLLSIIQITIGAYAGMLQFGVFGVSLSYIEGLFLASLGTLSLIISITPAGLGIGEAVTVFSALTLGITPVQSLSAAILGRGISILVLFTLGPISTYILYRAKPYHHRDDTRNLGTTYGLKDDIKKTYQKTKELKETLKEYKMVYPVKLIKKRVKKGKYGKKYY
ncbi:MAG: lysylphosphatidylglycerol synthase transmembrane domain-containing protein [Thermoplasmata archaeon]